MRNFITLVLFVMLFVACSDETEEGMQEYTSFTIMQNEIDNQPNTIVGYKTDDCYKKLANLGDLKKGIPSEEVIINDNTVKEIYVFSDYPYPSLRMDTILRLKSNVKNTFQLQRYTKGIIITDRTDPTQYPQ